MSDNKKSNVKDKFICTPDVIGLNYLENIFSKDKDLYKAIKRAFEDLYDKDKYLIDNRPHSKFSDNTKQLGKHHVGERAIVFRFAHYLQLEISKVQEYAWYNLDCEYNRNGDDAKIVNNKKTYPDMIIHKRVDNLHNLLVMEFKTYWNNDTKDDIEKICGLMVGEYTYTYGMVVIINEKIENLEFIIPTQEQLEKYKDKTSVTF